MTHGSNVPLLAFLILLCLASVIFFPVQFAKVAPDQAEKATFHDAQCIARNVTVTPAYNCKLYHVTDTCGCNVYYYYPCSYMLTQKLQGYCCDTYCPTNSSVNVVKGVICGDDKRVCADVTQATPTYNVTERICEVCHFSDEACLERWADRGSAFECYYSTDHPRVIYFSVPDFLGFWNPASIISLILIIAACGVLLYWIIGQRNYGYSPLYHS